MKRLEIRLLQAQFLRLQLRKSHQSEDGAIVQQCG